MITHENTVVLRPMKTTKKHVDLLRKKNKLLTRFHKTLLESGISFAKRKLKL